MVLLVSIAYLLIDFFDGFITRFNLVEVDALRLLLHAQFLLQFLPQLRLPLDMRVLLLL